MALLGAALLLATFAAFASGNPVDSNGLREGSTVVDPIVPLDARA